MTRRQGRQSPAMDASLLTGDGSGWDPVNDFLVNCLHRTDELLLGYLDGDNDLTVNTVKRLRFYASAMLGGPIGWRPTRGVNSSRRRFQREPMPLL